MSVTCHACINTFSVLINKEHFANVDIVIVHDRIYFSYGYTTFPHIFVTYLSQS